MPLDVRAAIREGATRTATRNGRSLLGAFFALQVANTVVGHTLVRSGLSALERLQAVSGAEPAFDPAVFETPTPFALPIHLGPALGLALALALIAEAARIVTVRTLVSDRTDAIPETFVTRRLARATLESFVAGIVVTVLVAVGTLLLVVPGVFLGLVFFFVRQEIAVEDKGVIDAMAGSWDLTEGYRLDVFWLAAFLFLVGALESLPALVLGAEAPTVSAAATAVVSAVTTVFAIAVAARAYAQLRAERAERFGLEPGDAGEEPAFAP